MARMSKSQIFRLAVQQKQPRDKVCKTCKGRFTPFRSLQVCCSNNCAVEYAQKARVKRENREYREAKEKQKSRADWLREAQTAFNSFIRARDNSLPCISCGRHHDGQYHAGHYLTVGARPELRFNEQNVHKQCSVCNNHLHGNLINYRIELIKRIGMGEVDGLESCHDSIKYTVEQLKDLKAHYKAKIKEL